LQQCPGRITNVAIFSSVTHLGSSPDDWIYCASNNSVPAIPTKNIKETGYFTINHINTKDIIADAHHTSANYDDTVSEFDKTNLEAEFKNGISTLCKRKSRTIVLQIFE
jgi:flavin reductase (DIM6/NTAB) family NADH-FMN oxidoreductase RutF